MIIKQNNKIILKSIKIKLNLIFIFYMKENKNA